MGFIQITSGVNQNTLVEITAEITVGRAPDNVLCLPDSRTSRRHASFRPEGPRTLITDLGSSNGTYVNGVRIPPSGSRILQDGDDIQICSTSLRFTEKHPDSQRSPARSSARPAADLRPRPRGDIRQSGSLSIIMTPDDLGVPAVEAAIDASTSMSEIRAEEQSSERGLREAVRRLQAMVRVAGALGAVTKHQDLLEKIMDSIFDIFPHADRAFIMLRDRAKDEMLPAVGRDRTRPRQPGEEQEFAVSRNIMNSAIEKRQSILCSNAQQDDRFAAQQSIVDLNICSVMCAPFVWKDEVLGVINVDTVRNLHTFKADDLAMLTGIAAQAAIALKNAHLYDAVQEETRNRAHLARYMSPDVVQAVLDGSIPLETGGRKARGTVFFADIVGFTSLAEKLSAIEVVDSLNRYFTITTDTVTRNKGTLHKFAGDMIMAFWNVMFPDPTPEYNAVVASLQMQTRVWSFDLDLKGEGRDPLFLGIGCNTGEFAAGNIGGEERIEFTVIGDNVNLGQRIESLAGRWQVFVSESTYLPIRQRCLAIRLPDTQVKGKKEKIRIYSVRGCLVDNDELVLCLPIRILGADGKPLGEGLISGGSGTGENLRLELATEVKLASGMSLIMEFNIPELHWLLRIAGQVTATNRAAHDGAAVYTRAELANLVGSDDALAFLQPGSLIESQREWAEIRRG